MAFRNKFELLCFNLEVVTISRALRLLVNDRISIGR